MSVTISGAPWYCSNFHITSETPLRSLSSLILIFIDVLYVILVPINLLFLRKLCTAAECKGDALAKV